MRALRLLKLLLALGLIAFAASATTPASSSPPLCRPTTTRPTATISTSMRHRGVPWAGGGAGRSAAQLPPCRASGGEGDQRSWWRG